MWGLGMSGASHFLHRLAPPYCNIEGTDGRAMGRDTGDAKQVLLHGLALGFTGW